MFVYTEDDLRGVRDIAEKMADGKPWVHSGWMSKQGKDYRELVQAYFVLIYRVFGTGHKYTGWKNRYFVLTQDTLSYYKEEVAVNIKND
jgi:hypothetical protein